MLTVGELAARAGLTVRTLHHYDSIGLLCPSARSDAGYRLYDRDDVARLQQIQALRGFGMGLADIGAYLDSPAASPLGIVERQLAALDRQIREAAQMRAQLEHLRTRLASGEQPDLSTWLTTLENMTMYEQYFSKEELARLPLYQNREAQLEWQELVRTAQSLKDSGVDPASQEAMTFAERWLRCLERDSGGDPAFVMRLTTMAAADAAGEQERRMSPQLLDYMRKAMAEMRFAIYGRYLPPETIARMRRHEESHADEWIELVNRIHDCMARDPEARSLDAQQLARRWYGLFTDMVGDDPDVVERFRQAYGSEPMLRIGLGIGDEVMDFLRRAMENLQAQQ